MSPISAAPEPSRDAADDLVRAADAPAIAPPPAGLDDLLGLTPDRLADLYAAASVPDLAAIRGDLRGRMLATVVLPPSIEALARWWASSSAFVWRGKSLEPRGPGRGEGINRVASDHLKLFRFETHVGRSRAGDFDAVHLDYDLPGNPRLIRAIQDEIRALRPGLYLGQAYLVLRGEARLILYFGLQG